MITKPVCYKHTHLLASCPDCMDRLRALNATRKH